MFGNPRTQTLQFSNPKLDLTALAPTVSTTMRGCHRTVRSEPKRLQGTELAPLLGLRLGNKEKERERERETERQREREGGRERQRERER